MRRLVFMLAVAATVAAAFVGAPTAALANGSCSLGQAPHFHAGTEADPIPIATVADFETFATDHFCFETTDVFLQTADLDLGGVARPPIGTIADRFLGTYDGGGHTLRGLVTSGTGPQGLFGASTDATIRNVVLVSPSVTSTDGGAGAVLGLMDGGAVAGVTVTDAHVTSSNGGGAGGLVGAVVAGSISDVSVTGAVVAHGSPFSSAGGLVGSNCGPLTLRRGATAATVRATGANASAGGAVGVSNAVCPGSRRAQRRRPSVRGPIATTVADVHATGAVASEGDAGGFIGDVGVDTLSRVSATGAVTGDVAGGFAAVLEGPTVTDAYAIGPVAATNVAGGFAARTTTAVLTNVYAAGAVTAPSGAAGLIQGLQPLSPVAMTVTAAYWDTQSTGQTSSLYGTGKTTAQMQSIGTFSGAGWTIAPGWSAAAARVWGICPIVNGGRPFLVSQYAADPCPTAPGAPRSVTVTPGDGKLTVSWTAPESDGGASVSEYTATATMQKQGAKAAPKCTATAPTATCTIAGLKNGRAYRVTVTATNVVGTGVAGAAASTVTPTRGLVVLSMRRSGHAVVTRVRVSSAGTLTQYGEPTRSNGVACRAATARPKRAGVVTLRCPLDAAAIRTLDAKALRLRIVTRFAPASGRAVTATRLVTFPLAAGAPVVTG